MSFLKSRFAIVVGGLWVSCAAFGNNLSTSTGAPLSVPGIFFEVQAFKDVEVSAFQLCTAVQDGSTAEIYWKPGTYIGSPLNLSEWTLVFQGTNYTIAYGRYPGFPNVLNDAVRIEAGETVSFFIRGSLAVFQGTTAGSDYVSNSDIKLQEGTGVSYPALGDLGSRNFSGVLQYTFFTPEPDPTPTPEPTPAPAPTLTVFGPNHFTTSRNSVVLQGSAPSPAVWAVLAWVRREIGHKNHRYVRYVTVDGSGFWKTSIKPGDRRTHVHITAVDADGRTSTTSTVKIEPSHRKRR